MAVLLSTTAQSPEQRACNDRYHQSTGGDTHEAAFGLTVAVLETLQLVFKSTRCYREIPLDLAPSSPANIVCIAGKSPVPKSPFPVPLEGDHAAPLEMSSFWIQRHFPEFEITSHLQKALDASALETDLAAANRVAQRDRLGPSQLAKGYRDLLATVYPPARDWTSPINQRAEL